MQACSIHLVPTRLAKLVERKSTMRRWSGISQTVLNAAPARLCVLQINLVQYMKLGKFHIQARRAAEAKKE